MKFIHILIEEFRTKWSTKLLVGIFALVVSSIFASNLMLKKEYDLIKNKPKDRFAGFQKILSQPFKHIMVDSGSLAGEIVFESSNQPLVYMNKTLDAPAHFAQSIFVKSDTLFVKLNEHNFSQFSDAQKRMMRRVTPFLHILASDIQSISVSNANFVIDSFQQKDLTISLSNNAYFEMKNSVLDLDFCTISMRNFSQFIVRETIVDKKINIKLLDVDMKDRSILYLKYANITNLKFNATQGNSVEMSSETLMNLMKK